MRTLLSTVLVAAAEAFIGAPQARRRERNEAWKRKTTNADYDALVKAQAKRDRKAEKRRAITPKKSTSR